MKKLPLLFMLLLLSCVVVADVKLPAIFTNNMVLQQNTEVTIWGWAEKGEKIEVITGWDNKIYTTEADKNAQWLLKVQTSRADNKPYTIKISGWNHIELSDVLLGEVWLCSGQSNMEWTANAGIDNKEVEIAAANYPNIRFFKVEKIPATFPQIDVKGTWSVCTPDNMRKSSAVAYYFGKAITEKLNVPIGLITSSWGGSPAEVWMNELTILSDVDFIESAKANENNPWSPSTPGSLYNSMIYPLIQYRIAGALWYQGESNTAVANYYPKVLSALVAEWRNNFGYEFPFYYVQIAPYNYGTPLIGVQLRDAQRKALDIIPNSGMIVVSDIGNTTDIHPRNKKDVGIRLANWALAKTYSIQGITYSGPAYKTMTIEKDKIRLTFDFADKGLVVKGKELTHFQISDESKIFVEAKAKIEGNTVIVWNPNVKKPVAVRFAWDNVAEPNLFNYEGLPASCFRTDEW